jgi:hypothetical protein
VFADAAAARDFPCGIRVNRKLMNWYCHGKFSVNVIWCSL